MKILKSFFVLALFAFIAGCASTGPKWECSANKLSSGSYHGGDTAYIHLSPYQTGSQYKVEKNPEGTEAVGVTRDGTPFKCVKVEKTN